MNKKVVTCFISFILMFILSLSSFASTEYVYTLADMTEYSQISYLDPPTGNFTPMTVSALSWHGYEWHCGGRTSSTLVGAQGALQFNMETVEPVSVPAYTQTVVLSFDFWLDRQFVPVMQGYQDAAIIVNGQEIPVDEVVVGAPPEGFGNTFSLVTNISDAVVSSASITGFKLTLNFKVNNQASQTGDIDLYGHYPVYTFYESSVEQLLPQLAGQIMDNQNKNTQQIIDNQNQNTQKIIDGDPANEEALKKQEEIYNQIEENEKLFYSSITGDLDNNTDDVLGQLKEINALTTQADIVESNNWIQQLFSSILPPVNVNYWAEYFILIPICLALVVMFSVKILRTVGPAFISSRDSGSSSKKREDKEE